ncbi:MAG: DUF1592 domain-containing protein [Pirellulaceae bacterium]|nr:DUF1592 domain-containing protein [Pirellulaceae bacterium]
MRCATSPPNLICRAPAAFLATVLVTGPLSSAEADRPSTASPRAELFSRQVQPLLNRLCLDCHGPRQQEAEINLGLYDSAESVLRNRETWSKISEMLQFGAMPPDDAAQPTQAERESLVTWINGFLALDCSQVRDPGRVTIRRLNRVEYDNTIRDLIGLDLKLARDFPSDDVGEGFDNIGDVLSLPPLLLEKYVDAAVKIAEQAIRADAAAMPKQRLERRDLTAVGSATLNRAGVYFLPSPGLVSGEFVFERDGQYVLRVEAGADQAGDERAKVEFSLDGRRLHVGEVLAPVDRMEFYEFKTPVSSGKHRFSAAFINDYYNPRASDPRDRDRNLAIRALEVVGPTDRPAGEPSRGSHRILTASPGDGRSPLDAAREVLERFAMRAYRRPMQAAEVDRLVHLADSVLDQGGSFEQAIQTAVAAVMVSPHFLFRIEDDSTADAASPVRELNGYELASRLSYFLWSSMPDDELFALAGRGELHNEAVLAQQVRRMIADPKSAALVENFGGQWLNLRNLDEATPDPKQFPGFDADLKHAMRRETELLFDAVMRQDRRIPEFLIADFTFVNERLAKHYGIDGVTGEKFQQIKLPADQRVGLLTQASILTLTSNPTRTSAVKRGKWIMENILGTPPPDPPANVPGLEETQQAKPDATLREQLVLHRQNAVCASCHIQMDELGFGFENFDPVGRWRVEDDGKPIDSAGELPSGERFRGPIELVRILSQRERAFAEALARKKLTYALGRGLQYYDQCAVEAIVQRMEQNDFRFSSLVLGIVTSEPFRMRRTQGENQ